ncbi:hypothetical protein D3C79_768240 [compost metagenome]
MQVEAVGHLQGQLRHDPQHAQRYSARLQQVGRTFIHHDDLAVGLNQLQANDRRSQVAQGQAGAVGARGQGAGDRLAVDVALVDHRQAGRPQRLAEGVDGGAGGCGDAFLLKVDVAHTAHVAQRQVQAVGQRHRGKRMPGTRHAHVHAIGARLADQGAQLVFAGGGATCRADTRLVARPIAPVRLVEPELVDVHVVR